MRKTVKLFIFMLLLGPGFAIAQNARVTGKVTGTDNQGLPGVNVQISGTTLGRPPTPRAIFAECSGKCLTGFFQHRLR
jgi:hypothetical protein